MDASTYEQQEQTLALLKMLAMGSRDIEQGRFRDAEAVFAELDKEEANISRYLDGGHHDRCHSPRGDQN